jgi:hypothetical protein
MPGDKSLSRALFEHVQQGAGRRGVRGSIQRHVDKHIGIQEYDHRYFLASLW